MRYLAGRMAAVLAMVCMSMPILVLNACNDASTAQVLTLPGSPGGSASPGSPASPNPGASSRVATCGFLREVGAVGRRQTQDDCGGGITPPPSGIQCLVYWEGGTNISEIPTGTTIVAAAFGGLSGHSITKADLGMGSSMSSNIAALHAKGMKVVLSLGGEGGSFTFDGNAAGFQSSLKSTMQTYGYDGVDFDDENSNVTQRVSDLSTLIPAAAQAVGSGLVTYAVYGDTSTGGDGTVLQKVASSISLLNVMSYAGSDVSTTEKYVTNYASYMSKSKTLLGLDYDGDLGGAPSSSALQQMTSWVKSNGYGGIMIWEAGTAGSNMTTALTDLGI